MKTTGHRGLSGCLAAALLALDTTQPPPRPAAAAARIEILPEGERSLSFVVVGTNPPNGKYYMLRELGAAQGVGAKERRELEAELFGLDVELTHGALFRLLPKETHLYVGVPGESAASSEEFFKRYLLGHCGFSPEDVGRRVHFFRPPVSVLFVRDVGKVLGLDARGRASIGSSPTDPTLYQDFVAVLAETYPERFAVHRLDPRVSLEGGDTIFGRLPDGSLAMIVGHHRFLNYLGRNRPDAPQLTDDEVKKAREAYSRAAFGVPVLVLPEAALKDASLASPELFHVDMVAALHSRQGKPDAFVPTLDAKAVDRMTGDLVPSEIRDAAQKEYDLVTSQLEALGYRVSRVPFSDHPARAPANLVRYVDAAGRPSVLLSKYPYHLPAGGETTPQARFKRALETFRSEIDYLNASARTELLPSWRAAFQKVWTELAEIEAAPSPSFDAKRSVFEERGYRLTEVPMFAWGSGGLHCLVFH